MKHKYLLFFAAIVTFASLGNSVKAQIADADEAFKFGYYKTAADLYANEYRKSHDPNIAYKIAESHRLANNYSKAIKYYTIVNNSSAAAIYPHTEYFLASMYRMAGYADSALTFYQKYLRTAINEQLEQRARQEARACQWVLDSVEAPTNFTVKHESKNINTEYSESGAVMMGDSLLFFSSMREISKPGSKNAVFSDLVLMQIFQADFSGDSPNEATVNNWGLNNKEKHSCNVAFDPRHNNIYFTLCQTDDFANIPCEIYVSHYSKGKWQKAKKVGGDVNLAGYTSTQPTVGYLADGTTILYFVSDRPGGVGGMVLCHKR